jgi:hypothetical protein
VKKSAYLVIYCDLRSYYISTHNRRVLIKYFFDISSARMNDDDDKLPNATELLPLPFRSDHPIQEILKKDYNTDFLLQQTVTSLSCNLDDRTNWLLFFAGLNLNYQNYKNPFLYYVHILWNLFIMVALLTYALFPVVLCIVAVLGSGFNLFEFIIFFVMFLQSVALGWVLYCNYRRLNEKALVLEVEAYKKLIPEILAVTALLVAAAFPFLAFAETGIQYFVFTLILESTASGACLLFITADAEVCRTLITHGMQKFEENTLTLQFVQEIRTHMEERIAKHNLGNSVLITVAILNLGALLILSFFLHSIEGTIVWLLAFFFRELVVALVAFWKVAQVNEASSKLVKIVLKSLEGTSWMDSLETNQLRQLQLFLSLSGNRISYPLMGAKLTRKDVLLRFSLWLVGSAIGLLRDHLNSSVN